MGRVRAGVVEIDDDPGARVLLLQSAWIMPTWRNLFARSDATI
jgi:hypothetical protein